MKVGELKEATNTWVARHVAGLPGYVGSFYRGSMIEAADTANMAPTSDIDLTHIFVDDVPTQLPPMERIADWDIGGGLCWPLSQVQPFESVLCDYRVGFGFREPNILPGAQEPLVGMAALARQEFPKLHWVHRRIDDAAFNCRKYVDNVASAPSDYQQVLICLWAAGILAHVILAAGLRNPTVRKRYLLARQVMAAAGQLDDYERLLAVQGSREWDRQLTQAHLDTMAKAFDAASALPGARGDVSPAARRKAIDGSQALIDTGWHRESVFWIVASYARSMMALQKVGQESNHESGWARLRNDLGLASATDVTERTAAIGANLPDVLATAHEVAQAHDDVLEDAPSTELDPSITQGVLQR